MENINSTTQPFKTLQIVHGAQCLSVILFLAITVILNGNKGHIAVEPNDSPLLYIALVIAIGAPFLSNNLYQKKVAKIDLSAPLSKKFPEYTSACIIRYALLNGAGLLNIVVWFTTRNLIAAIVSAGLIAVLIIIRPTKNRITHILQISYPETLN
jgi:hypothetical protein